MPLIGLQIHYNYIRSLMHMAKKDSITDLANLHYINWVAEKLGLSKDELTDIAEGEQGFSAPYSTQERLTILHQLMSSFYGDEAIPEPEKKLCTELAIKMEIRIKSVDNLWHLIKENNNKLIKHSAFKKICV